MIINRDIINDKFLRIICVYSVQSIFNGTNNNAVLVLPYGNVVMVISIKWLNAFIHVVTIFPSQAQ